jgi:hypothetical protein
MVITLPHLIEHFAQIQVPSLIQVIKDTGLLVGVFAGSSNTPSDMSIEAILSKDGNVTFTAS